MTMQEAIHSLSPEKSRVLCSRDNNEFSIICRDKDGVYVFVAHPKKRSGFMLEISFDKFVARSPEHGFLYLNGKPVTYIEMIGFDWS